MQNNVQSANGEESWNVEQFKSDESDEEHIVDYNSEYRADGLRKYGEWGLSLTEVGQLNKCYEELSHTIY